MSVVDLIILCAVIGASLYLYCGMAGNALLRLTGPILRTKFFGEAAVVSRKCR